MKEEGDIAALAIRVRASLLVVFVLSLCISSFAGKAQKPNAEWLPISPSDWAVKEVPGRTGAPAIQLYFSYYKDDDQKFISVYHRIKILSDSGRKYADVEIPLDPGESLKEVKARSLHSDGSVIEYQGKPFEKVIRKRRSLKYSARVFTVPDVSVGSIVEYRYTISLPPHVVDTVSPMPVQGDLYTVKEELRFRAYQGVVMVPTEWAAIMPKSRVSYAYLNQVDARVPEKKEGNLMELDLDDVPSFETEDYMPPEDDFRPVLLFYYGGRESVSPEKFWEEWQKIITQYVEKFVAANREVEDAAAKAIGNESDPEKKLRRLYARAQQIRNISYERERTSEELKQEHIKGNSTARDVLQRGYASSWEIDATFVALARAAGFDATLLGVTNRRDRSFNERLLLLEMLDGQAALVRMNGTDLFLDPGTRFCPYGLLPWNHTATPALRFGKNAGQGFISMPQPSVSPISRTAVLSVAGDGAAKGEIKIEYQGQEALEHRIEALDTDEVGRRKKMEDDLAAWLPQGAIVKMSESAGWNSAEGPLTAQFTVEIPEFASVAGKRLLAPAFLFSTLQKGMFNHEGRIYPVAFPYPFVETDEVTIKLPEGFGLEQPPYRRKAGLSYAAYEVSTVLNGDQLTTKRLLRLDGLSFPPEQYTELKGFFSVVIAGDGGQAVLQPREKTARSQQ